VFQTTDAVYALDPACESGACTVSLATRAEGAPSIERLAIVGLEGPWSTVARVEVSDRGTVRVVEVPVVVVEPPEEMAVLTRARALIEEAKSVDDGLDEVERLIESAAPWARLWLHRVQARLLAKAGRSGEAARVSVEAAKLAGDLGVLSEVASQLGSASYYHSWAGNVEEALVRAQQSVEFAQRTETGEHLFAAHYNLGLALHRAGDLLGAAREYRAALDVWPKEASDSRMVAAVIELAAVESALGRHDQSLGRLGSIPAATRARLSEPWEAKLQTYVAHTKLGAHLAGHQRFPLDELLASFEALPATWRRLDDRGNEQLETFNLISAHSLLGRYEAAARLLEAYDERFGARPFFHSDQLRQLRGEIALGRGRLDEAQRRFSAALEAARAEATLGASEWTWRAEYGLARVAARRGDAKAADAAYRAALADRRRAAALTSVQEGRDTFLADRFDVVRDAAAFFLGRDDVKSAVEVWDAERSGYLASLDALSRRTRLSDDARAELLDEIATFRAARDAYEASRREVRELKGKARRDAVLARRAQREDLERRFEAIYALLDRRGADAAEALPGLEKVQARLGPDEALLFELPGPRWADADTSSTAWIDGDRVRLVPRESLVPELVANGGREKRPLRHVYLVARPRAPLAALPGQLAGDAPLAAQISFSTLPYAAWLERAPTTTASGAVVVADPEGDLPNARRETGLVERFVEAATALTGEQARRAALLGALASPRRLFHFAGHGVLAPVSPWDSHLRLADDETLNLEDVLLNRPEADLVILNGCETGARAGPVDLFAFGLAEAFLIVGADAVVATTRRVRDTEASAIIEAFYERGGLERPAAALAAATTWAQTRGFNAWDAFRLIGRR
jgi:tetratricopeptide (TPR) repeat protein